MHEQDFVAKAPRLPEVVRHHHDLGPARVHRANGIFDFVGGAGIETRGRLVEKQDFRRKRPSASEGESLLFTAREHACRVLGKAFKPDPAQRV